MENTEFKNNDSEIKKEELYFERECIYLDCKYSEHILNLYFIIKEYLKNKPSFLLKNMRSVDLEELIVNHSSLYDVYYDSENENENSDIDEYDYY